MGWCDRVKVIAPRKGNVKRQRVLTADHVTAHLCISADGKVLPPCIIFKDSFPHRTYKDGVPGIWLFATSIIGYMNTDIFCQWFERCFLPNCGRARPVVLVMDNHNSHVSLPLIESARANQVVGGFTRTAQPHLLQPLDVHINGPLKEKVKTVCRNLGLYRCGVNVSNAKLQVVLAYALDQVTPSSIKEAFRRSGLYPPNRQAIPEEDLVPSSFQVQTPDENEPPRTCGTCGHFLAHLAEILVPPPVLPKPQRISSRSVTAGRVISGDEMLRALQDKAAEEERKQVAIEERAKQREEKRKRRLEEEEERLVKRRKRDEEMIQKEEQKKRERAE
ncbi:hypothetical protein MAR_008823 [Mya arenaria]|uniref:DDE-1 domain-containing protein n=1 Tax=Mya arenaria TaxID=6604 RepID=A0ABY7DXQ9_MYAAR|nr:hypothetical protein MAR_008823 [Mya arenaria]